MRCSRGLQVAQLIGGAAAYEQSDGDDGEAGLGYVGTLHQRTRLSVALELDGRLHGVALDGQSAGGYAVVQAALRYTGEYGEPRLRVMTARVALTSSTEALLGALRTESCTLLLGKQLLLQATLSDVTYVTYVT